MFPTTVTIHNISDLQKVMSVLYPTTGVIEVTDTSRDVQTLVNNAEAKVVTKKSSTSAATPAAAASTQPTAEVVAETAAPVKTAAESSPTAAPAEAAQPASTAADKVDYPTLQKAVFTLAGKSREAAAALAQSFGVKTFKELPEAKWAEALAAVNAKLAELGA